MSASHLTRAISLAEATFDTDILKIQREIATSQEKLTTGLRINRPSDDASAYNRARQIEVLQEQHAQYERSINAARTWVDHGQENLDNLAEIMTQIYETGVQASNDTNAADEFQALSSQIQALQESMIDLMNAKVGDEYLHAGTRTTIRPFVVDPVDPTRDAADVVYVGNTSQRTHLIGPNMTLQINISGNTIWNVDEDLDGTSDYTITESINDLYNAVQSGDFEAMRSGISRVQHARDHLINLGSNLGTIGNQLSLAQDQLISAETNLARHRSQLEDADYTQTILDFQEAQSSLQATLQVTGSILNTSLLNFI